MSNREPPKAETEIVAAAASDANLRTQEPVGSDAQATAVSEILHEQANRLTDEATHTTHQADLSRAAAVRLDQQADELHQRAEHLHTQADHLGGTIKS